MFENCLQAVREGVRCNLRSDACLNERLVNRPNPNANLLDALSLRRAGNHRREFRENSLRPVDTRDDSGSECGDREEKQIRVGKTPEGLD